MIKEVTCCDIICDRCGKSLTEESEMFYPDNHSALMVAEQSEWKKISGKHYCPDCYELDEETDEYVEKCDKTIFCGECEKIPLRRYIRIWCLRQNQRWMSLLGQVPLNKW